MILLAVCSIRIAIYAQPSSNYFAIVSSNTYIHGISKQEFFAGSASRTDTTNLAASVDYLSGYLYPSNFSGYTTWTFPARIIISTNALISLHVLTTNTGTTVAGFYRIKLHSTNSVAPLYDSGNTVWLGSVAPTTTNLMIVKITNHFPANLISYTTNVVGSITNVTSSIVTSNIISATFSVGIGPVVGNWYPLWITGGKIEF